MKGDTLVLMLNGVEREYTTLHRSNADSSSISGGTIYLLHGQEGQGTETVSLTYLIIFLVVLGKVWLSDIE